MASWLIKQIAIRSTENLDKPEFCVMLYSEIPIIPLTQILNVCSKSHLIYNHFSMVPTAFGRTVVHEINQRES
jgi:hypothetical protein